DSDADGHGDFRGVIEKLDYLQDLGVDCIWLLPIYPSPLKDDGYDIADYYGVLEKYGTVEDFKQLVETVHERGMRIVADLVLNHTSDQHEWFQRGRRDPNSPYQDYYVWSDTDQKFKDARIIFIDTEDSNWAWDEVAQKYYWHRFYSSQPDLNFDNEAVQKEMMRVMKFWLEMGVDGFRADAMPYLFEREGTSCENLPETHAYLKDIRAYLDENFSGKVLLAEANQWPEDVVPYFGDGRDEFHMGFHFPLMPRIYMALKSEDHEPIEWILNRTPELTEATQWCIFLRNHDELTLEMVTEEERQWMWEQYAPEPRMRLNLGIRRRLAPLLDNDRRKIELANSILFTMPGSPIIYYGDEIGMGDNIWLDDRNGVRTPMQWTAGENAGFSAAKPEDLYLPVIDTPPYAPAQVNVADQRANPESLWHTLRRMVAVRKQHKVFGWGKFGWVDTTRSVYPKEVLAYIRRYEGEQVLVVQNLSGQPQHVELDAPGGGNPLKLHELLSDRKIDILRGDKLILELAAYEYLWILL
ncbi:MAG TPA: maltose alpha-D-glucosyltransferase, partial [Anaerolineales bacterium]|nr:maltose alpha-D-glucosyltransferase [Anaerolineales bacterium]